jgi:hypothetical protein
MFSGVLLDGLLVNEFGKGEKIILPPGHLRIEQAVQMPADFNLTAPPWGSPAAWREANQTVDHLIRLHQPELDRAVALALKVQVKLESIFSLIDELCLLTCPRCPDPCCLAAKVWINFQDLLFLHLSAQKIPPAQMMSDLKEICRYLGAKGCTLPRIVRPWICTWYCCPSQTANLNKMPPAIRENFTHTIQAIKAGRKEMDAEFIRVISG